uniref:RDD domain-containing protein n=1 Tax=Strigamia maritima TaxID=126957 RepID=T1IKK7_STRMM
MADINQDSDAADALSHHKLKGAQSVREYTKSLNHWLHECYYWQNVASGFPYYVYQTLNQPSASSSSNRQLFSTFQTQINTNVNVDSGRDFVIPQLWKRFAAEFIDFFILFLLKLVVTFIAIDFFDVVDLDKYDLSTLHEDLLDYRLAFEMTSEIIMLEVIHRFVVCFFEAMCIHRGTPTAGGATPGKSLLGLKVVSCSRVQELGNGVIRVQPGGDLGFSWALLRSFIKNFSLAFFFPICFTLFLLPHNRTAYDVLCNSIVVEADRRR